MFLCKTQKLAGWLMLKGFVLKRMDKDREDPKRNVFIFNKSDALFAEIDNYKKEVLTEGE